MRVIVQGHREDKKNAKISIPIPTFIISSKFILRKIAKKAEFDNLTKANIKTLSKEIRKAKKTFKKLLLIDVESSDGVKVKVYL
jgi:hypothetical protein